MRGHPAVELDAILRDYQALKKNHEERIAYYQNLLSEEQLKLDRVNRFIAETNKAIGAVEPAPPTEPILLRPPLRVD